MKTKENILLDEIEASEEFEAFRVVVENTLQDQWVDITVSGVIEEIYNEIGGPITKARTSPIRRLINRWIASGAVRDFSKIQRWVTDKVSGRIKRVGKYPGYGMATKSYLYTLFNKGGEAELAKYLGVDTAINFKLTNKLIAEKLRERAATLYKDWSKTTAQKFATQLIHGIRDGETRAQLVNRLTSMNEGIAKTRAELIVRTETAAAIEWARLQFALMNGVEWKIWWATLDERTSQICRETNGETIPVDAVFSCGCEAPPAHPNCLHKETRVMTREGMKLLSEVQVGEYCLSLDTDTRETSWQKVIKTHKQYKEKIIRIKNYLVNVAATEDHDFVFITDWDYHNSKKITKESLATMIQKYNPRIVTSGAIHNGEDGEVEIAGRIYKKKEFARFMGWYLSEGSTKEKRPGKYTIKIAQEKSKNFKDIEETIEGIGIKFYKTEGGYQNYTEPELGEYLKAFGYSYEKFVPAWIKEASVEVIEAFLSSYIKGDGNVKVSKNNKKGIDSSMTSIATASDRMKDDLCELIVKIGKRPSVKKQVGRETKHHNGVYKSRDVWVVNILNKETVEVKKEHVSEEEYNDYVYCVELEDKNTIFVEANGQFLWTGNCRSHLEYVYDNYGEEDVDKARKVYKFYQKVEGIKYPKGLNREYIWAGGNSYIGKDRDMDKYIGLFSKEDYKKFTRKELDTMAEELKGYPYSSYFDVNEFRQQVLSDTSRSLQFRIEMQQKTNSELAVLMARAKLTNKGFEQLLRKI